MVHRRGWIRVVTAPSQKPLTPMGGTRRISAAAIDPLLAHLAKRGGCS